MTEDSRLAKSADSSEAAALHFAQVITRKRGQVNNDDIQLVKEAGFSDQDLIEIVLNVVSNTLTNYVNHLAQTEIDFPKIASGQFKQAV